MFKRILIVIILIEIRSIKTIEISEIINRIGINIPRNLTQKCQQQMDEFLRNLQFNQNSWALKMLDATSKLPSGLFSLNFGELGSFDQCIQIVGESTIYKSEIYGKYCLGTVDPSIFNLNVSKITPTWAVCLPNQCTSDDITIIVNTLLTTLLIGFDDFTIKFDDLYCQTRDDIYPKLTIAAIITISLSIFLLILVIISTIYDLYCYYNDKQSVHEILIAWSLYTNGRKVFRTRPTNRDQLPCLDGLKFISMMWVVSGHTFSLPPISGAIVNLNDVLQWINSWRSMFIVSGTLSVDTFFVITGCLMSYVFMIAQYKRIKFNIFLYYLHRYLRLTPCLAMVVLFSSTMLKYFGSGPRWPLVDLYLQENCQKYWWSTLLYIQNYINIDQMCVGQTWYLNIDMQLYIISPILFYILWKWPKFGLLTITLFIVITLGLSFYTAWSYQLTAILSNLHGNKYDYDNHYYLLTHTRAGPWLIGVILGYILFKIKTNQYHYQLKTVIILLLWLLCFLIILLCIFGGFSTLRNQNYDKWGNSLHITFVRPIWSLCISWIIFCCIMNYSGPINWFLSLPIYQILNRFTYSIYLTHVTILFMVVFSMKTPTYFSDFNMAYSFWGILWFGTLVSVVLVFTIESPMIVIEKILFSDQKMKMKQTETSIEEGGIDNPAFNQ